MNEITNESNYSLSEIETKKILACTINLGAQVVSELIGNSVGKPQSIEEDLPNLVACALISELSL